MTFVAKGNRSRLIPLAAWGTLTMILGIYLAGWIIQRESGWPIDPAEQAVVLAFLGLSAVARTVQPTHLFFWLRERRADHPAVQV